MKGFVFLVVAVSTALSLNQDVQKTGSDIVECGKDRDMTDTNKDQGLSGDIMEKPQRSAIIAVDRLWTSPVPYVLGDDLEMNAKGVIMRAFDQFRIKSCIDFKPRDSEDYYINVRKLGGCFSYIGRVIRNGQVLSIGRYCDEISTVEHEFLHAFGFYHEQTRYDRDNYVTIAFENIIKGYESNFKKVSSEASTTHGIPYDYISVMHYGKNAFSNGNGSTIITKDPKFQDVIGQRQDMSPRDVTELNLLYKCNSTIAFKLQCSFTNGSMCQMDRCSQSGRGWEMVTRVDSGPSSDHTSLSNSNTPGRDRSYFMHASTASGKRGDSAWLETKRMRPNRDCHVQCLQFYNYHSGSESDELNIWIREFKDEWDLTGTLRLMGQITGPAKRQWQLQHVSLNANRHFQVEFEARKGAGSSSGGFSIDDINLSEIECPHVTMQINDFENLLKTSAFGTVIRSPRQYSRAGYSFLFGVLLFRSYIGVFVQLVSGKYDDQLEWPLPQRQSTFQMVDQNPNLQQHMSKQRSITSDRSRSSSGAFYWGNPREVGTPFIDENNQTVYGGPRLGRGYFASLDEMKSRDFLMGGSAIFVFSFQDLTPLVNGSTLPCPKVTPVQITNPPKAPNTGPCSSRILTTTRPPPKTTDDDRILTTTRAPPKTTDDDSIFGFSPRLVSCPVLAVLLALMLLIP